MNTTISPEWLESLRLSPRVGKEFVVSIEHAATLPCAQVVIDALEVGVSGVFCVDGAPRAAVVSIQRPEDEGSINFQELYTILWNQGELDFLLMLRCNTVEIHTLLLPPDEATRAEGKNRPSLLDVLRFIEDAADIADLISGLESGRLLAEHEGKFTKDDRVDETLIRDLDGARYSLLTAAGYKDLPEAPKEFVSKAHDVLLQAMFLLYLEDRGIMVPSTSTFTAAGIQINFIPCCAVVLRIFTSYFRLLTVIATVGFLPPIPSGKDSHIYSRTFLRVYWILKAGKNAFYDYTGLTIFL